MEDLEVYSNCISKISDFKRTNSGTCMLVLGHWKGKIDLYEPLICKKALK